MSPRVKILLLVLLTGFAFSLVAGSAYAKKNKNNTNGCKPGWGWGDKNHCHSGPPGGPSTHPVFGKPGTSVRRGR